VVVRWIFFPSGRGRAVLSLNENVKPDIHQFAFNSKDRRQANINGSGACFRSLVQLHLKMYAYNIWPI
jgi:hypothetical protein